MPNTFRVVATNHTSFTVTDLEATVGFFRDCLGFPAKMYRPERQDIIRHITGVSGGEVLIAFVQAPQHTLEFIEYTAPPERANVRPRPCDVGFAHLAFEVEGLAALVAAAAGHGFEPVAPPIESPAGRFAGKNIVYIRNGEGLTLELIGP